MKAKEAKKLNEKKKLEKLKEKEAAEQNAERAEAAQKVMWSMYIKVYQMWLRELLGITWLI